MNHGLRPYVILQSFDRLTMVSEAETSFDGLTMVSEVETFAF